MKQQSFKGINYALIELTIYPTSETHYLTFQGFRKVDPDSWEFAHVSFLRGQTHFLRHIVRRNSGGSSGKKKEMDDGDSVLDDDSTAAMVAMEVVHLKQEQRAIDEKVALMWQRVKETEHRPKQMLAFLVIKRFINLFQLSFEGKVLFTSKMK